MPPEPSTVNRPASLRTTATSSVPPPKSKTASAAPTESGRPAGPARGRQQLFPARLTPRGRVGQDRRWQKPDRLDGEPRDRAEHRGEEVDDRYLAVAEEHRVIVDTPLRVGLIPSRVELGHPLRVAHDMRLPVLVQQYA